MEINVSEPYTTLLEAVHDINQPNQDRCISILTDFYELFSQARGSRVNHQAWVGGYYDHILETMNVAKLDYEVYQAATKRKLPFELSDALLVLYLHDLEKPWKYAVSGTEVVYAKDFQDKNDQANFRLEVINKYQIELTDVMENALFYAEGEWKGYSNGGRAMNELAAFVHRCDLWSARIFPNHPLEKDETWGEISRTKLS